MLEKTDKVSNSSDPQKYNVCMNKLKNEKKEKRKKEEALIKNSEMGIWVGIQSWDIQVGLLVRYHFCPSGERMGKKQEGLYQHRLI
jgi:hypothetical protein